ncbi:MAG: hypothetical protein JJE36_01175 [Coriobacteriia bacterium]|nr:hypothetical protein [Coriobacteriia bacterium]
MAHSEDKPKIDLTTGKIAEVAADLKKDILESTEDGRIQCESARGLAHKYGVSTKSVGAMIDEMDIRVYDCGLGCF